MTHASRFRNELFTELAFGVRHLEPLRTLYRRLRDGRLPSGQRFNRVTGLHPNMAWHYAATSEALEPFAACLADSNLNRSLRIVEGEPRLYAACFIVISKRLPPMEYHIDFGEEVIPAGVSSTMLTPLFPFAADFGHLEYRADEDDPDHEYRYELGKAILFDGKFEHRSQSFRCRGSAERVLVSWTIASTEPRYSAAIRRVVDSQAGSLEYA